MLHLCYTMEKNPFRSRNTPLLSQDIKIHICWELTQYPVKTKMHRIKMASSEKKIQPSVLLDASHFCTDAAAAFQFACLASSQVATLIHPNGSEMWSYFLGWLALAQNPAILQSFVEGFISLYTNNKKMQTRRESIHNAMDETKSYLIWH